MYDHRCEGHDSAAGALGIHKNRETMHHNTQTRENSWLYSGIPRFFLKNREKQSSGEVPNPGNFLAFLGIFPDFSRFPGFPGCSQSDQNFTFFLFGLPKNMSLPFTKVFFPRYLCIYITFPGLDSAINYIIYLGPHWIALSAQSLDHLHQVGVLRPCSILRGAQITWHWWLVVWNRTNQNKKLWDRIEFNHKKVRTGNLNHWNALGWWDLHGSALCNYDLSLSCGAP